MTNQRLATMVMLASWMILGLSCTGTPDGVTAVSGFQLDRYLGTWYEIARLDHSFERGLERVTATYDRRDDGGVSVLNKGYNPEKQEWKSAQGRAYFVGDPSIGMLKVSFFGPFYGGYNIIALDQEGYNYAMICGPSRSYLWILARTPSLDNKATESLIKQAGDLGFPVDELIFVRH